MPWYDGKPPYATFLDRNTGDWEPVTRPMEGERAIGAPIRFVGSYKDAEEGLDDPTEEPTPPTPGA